VRDDERDDRTAWRACFSRFAVGEAKPNLNIRTKAGRTVVAGNSTTVTMDDDVLIEAVMGRLDEHSPLDAATQTLLSTMP
jgi:hypothetical protein